MNILLDTHVFLWFVNDDPQLNNSFKDLIESNNSSNYLSIASLWEMSIKYNLGKLSLEPSYDEFIRREVSTSNIILLDIKLQHLSLNSRLPFHHRDPFDRIIIAQSVVENIPIVTVDSAFNQYSVNLISV